MKTCQKCGEEFPAGGRCAACKKAYNRAYYKRNAERERQRALERHHANPSASHARNRKWREANPERHRDNNREWRTKNAEHHRARARQWAIDNPDQYKERLRRWRVENADYIREQRQTPEQRIRHRAHQHRRRALKANTANSLLGGYSAAYMAHYMAELLTHPCEYCGGPGETVEHIVPLSRGGLDIPANLASACLHCNCSKQNRLPSEWDSFTQFLA